MRIVKIDGRRQYAVCDAVNEMIRRHCHFSITEPPITQIVKFLGELTTILADKGILTGDDLGVLLGSEFRILPDK